MNKKETQQSIKAFAEIVNNRAEGDTVKSTIIKMCAAFGYDVVRETIAATIKAHSDDGRIKRSNKEKAATVETFNLCGEWFANADSIHPAHLDNIADLLFYQSRKEFEPVKEFERVNLEPAQETEASAEPAPDYMPRPTYYGQKGRALVWYWRACSAYDLAARLTGADNVTEIDYNTAKDLLNRVTRYACNAARQWERANIYERYANSQQARDDEKRLDARRERLQSELRAYGVKMVNYGLYPSIVDGNNYDLNALHFFN